MNVAFNTIVVAFILLIAYWWSNQGLFSSIIHCICVILAGAIAFAFWEPVVVGLLLRGGDFDNYAWGMALGLLFFFALFVLRIAADLLIPFDVPLPPAISAIGGGIFGFAAGVLTIGMTAIACGFMQGPTEIMGYVGWARGPNAKGAPMQFNEMWIPAPNITESFYKQVSLGSLSPARTFSLATHYPDLAKTALSLHRDTFRNGDGRVGIAPKDVKIGNLIFDANYQAADGAIGGAYAVEITVQTGGYDNGEQFILSCAQAKLANTDRNPRVSYPTKFRQPVEGGESRVYTFEDIGNFATSAPAEQEAKVTLFFPASDFAGGISKPTVFFLKGLRYLLAVPLQETNLAAQFAAESGVVSPDQSDASPDGGYLNDVSEFVRIKNSVQPVQLNVNLADTMTVTSNDSGNYLGSGKGVYKKGSAVGFSRTQKVSGFYHPTGTEVLMVDVTRGGKIDMWGDGSKTFKELGKEVPLELVDSLQKAYKPVGYVWERQSDVEIRFEPSKPFKKISELPPQPQSGEHRLQLVFIVPVGTVIQGIRIGKTLIGTCNVTAKNGFSD